MTLSPPADPVSEAWAKGLEVGDEVVAATKQGWWYATMGGGVEDSDEVWVQDDAVWVVRDLHLTPAPRSIRTLGRRRHSQGWLGDSFAEPDESNPPPRRAQAEACEGLSDLADLSGDCAEHLKR